MLVEKKKFPSGEKGGGANLTFTFQSAVITEKGGSFLLIDNLLTFLNMVSCILDEAKTSWRAKPNPLMLPVTIIKTKVMP